MDSSPIKPSSEEETRVMLRLLELGEQQVVEGKTVPLQDVAAALRTRLAARCCNLK